MVSTDRSLGAEPPAMSKVETLVRGQGTKPEAESILFFRSTTA